MRSAGGLSIFFVSCLIGLANAETTEWMTYTRAQKYPPFIKKQVYGTGIECREGRTPRTVLVRFQTSAVNGKRKPFHKWQFVVSRTSDLDRTIDAIRLRDHPELKYRIVDQHTYTSTTGENVSCALLYRGTGPV